MSQYIRSPLIPGTYDIQIQAACKEHLKGIDWRLLKAQYFQESRLNPKAVSPAGAKGIAQFMPLTWTETVGLLKWPENSDPFDANLSIEAGAHYLKRMRAAWAGCQPLDQHMLALASYNAGLGNLRRACREAGVQQANAALETLPKITGKHAKETQTYVERIYRWYAQLLSEANDRVTQ